MGTNFYLRCKNPRPVYDEFHIAKTSGGWKPLFEADPPAQDGTHWEDLPENLSIRSIDDIKRHYDSGNYVIMDENGEQYDWDDFIDRVVNWNAENDNAQRHGDVDLSIIVDPQGYEFTQCEFC